MRHGAGPFRSSHEIKAETANDLSADIGTLSLTDNIREQRLGCYFCNDVVAPIDVNTIEATRLGYHHHLYIYSLSIMKTF